MAKRPSPSFCIAGAGIVGLTLALALAKLGARVSVLERQDEIQEFGAGLQISPNARRALDALGLDAEMRAISFEPKGINVFPFRRPHALTTLELGSTAVGRYGCPYAVMHRADLVKMLFNACKRFANIDVRFGVRKFDVETDGAGVRLEAELANSQSAIIRADAFIGADGVGSRTRTEVLGGTEAKYTGYVAWRALIDMDKLTPDLSPEHTNLMWGPGFHAIAYPVPNRRQFNIALFSKETMSVAFGIRSEPHLPPVAKKDPRFAKILSQVSEWTHWPLAAVDAPKWFEGPVGIVGDAAHAMLPFQAQGAAMGIEDAVMLAPLLLSAKTAEDAFRQFSLLRRGRVARVAKISQSNGRVFHLRAPFATARNLVVRLQGKHGHLNRLNWLYDYDPTAQ